MFYGFMKYILIFYEKVVKFMINFIYMCVFKGVRIDIIKFDN